jgi:hypothetical protein
MFINDSEPVGECFWAKLQSDWFALTKEIAHLQNG